MTARGAAAVLGLILISACGGARQAWLPQYRVLEPRAQLGEPRWLAEFTSDELHGRLAPDGQRLAYAGVQKGSLDIWIKDLATGEPKRVTRHVAIDTQPSWSPDGKSLAFVSMRDDAKGDIYLWRGGSSFRRVSGRQTADSYPVFAADGRSLFYAAGPEGQSRIVRQSLADDEPPKALTGWGATHPAVSPDGHYLAYTRFGAARVGQIIVRSLASGREWAVSSAERHAGFPCFSPDSKQLYYSRFMRGRPGAPLEEDADASLWRVSLVAARAAGGPAAAQAAAVPLTSDGGTVLFAQAHPRGIVFTSPRRGSLDVGLLPSGGLVPRLATAAAQRALADAQDEPWRELLCLERVWRRADAGALAGEARYRATVLWRRQGELARAEEMLRRLAADTSAATSRAVAALAAIDLIVLPVEQVALGGQRGKAAPMARAALTRLVAAGDEQQRVAAYRALRRADLQRLGDRRRAAIAGYEGLLARYPAQRALGAEAKLRLGQLFDPVREPNLLARYYLTIFNAFPGQRRWLDEAVQAVFSLFSSRAPLQQVEALRRLIDGNRDKPRFCARAQRRIGRLYERAGRLPLAIAAMVEVTRDHGADKALAAIVTAAAFDLGRLSLSYSEQLRRKGRLGEALAFYGKARDAYQQVVRRHEPAHEAHQRARAEYIRLSLLEATQLERDGERALAEKRYRKLVEFDLSALQAHRRLISLGLRAGRKQQLVARYEALLGRRGVTELFVGHYGLGYLATFEKPLDGGALDRATKHLARAVALRPQSPFGHMTLGWVQEMRERRLGETRKGWLEEAITSYERAYALNDGARDRKTEGDLLVNLCNSFANLGNGWELAYDYCAKRARLKLPFLSSEREAYHRLVYARSAAATGRHQLAARQLDQALELARRLGYRRLEAQVIARKAFSASLRGEHREAIRLFGRTIGLLQKQRRMAQVAALTRAIAQSQLALGERAAAERSLQRAGELLASHGTPDQGGWAPTGGPFGSSVSPLGFDVADERNAQRALLGLIYRQRSDWRLARAQLRARIRNRVGAEGDRGDAELGREALLLRNELALLDQRLGAGKSAVNELEQAYVRTKELQTVSGELEPDGELFPLQVALALNLAELLQRRLEEGQAGLDAELVRRRDQLRGLERLRAAWVTKQGKPLLPERLRLSLWGDLASLSLTLGLRHVGGEAKPPQGKSPQGKPPQGKRNKAEARALAALTRLRGRGELLSEAVSLFRRVERQTRPLERSSSAATAASSEGSSDLHRHGAMAAVWRPLRSFERLRWHVRAGLNLAASATVFVADEQLAKHPTTELLARLADLCRRHDLGALRYVVAAELAQRRRDARAMSAAVDSFLGRSPYALGHADRRGASSLRRQVLGRAIGLALEQGRHADALALAERMDRRAFVDELVALGPAGRGQLAEPVRALVAAGRAYAKVFAERDPGAAEKAAKAGQHRLDRARRRVEDAVRALSRRDPQVAGLFSVEPFDVTRLAKALAPGDVLITAVEAGERQQLLVLTAKQPRPRAKPLGLSRATLAKPAGHRALRRTVARLAGAARRVYLDLGRLGVWPAGWQLGDREIVLLSGCWQLLDAQGVRSPPRSGGLAVAGKPAEARGWARRTGLDAVSHDPGAGLGQQLEEAGVLVWSKARFGGGSSANLRLPLPPVKQGASSREESAGPRRLELGRQLGLRLRGQLLLFGAVEHVPGRERLERIALARLLHAAGLPAYAVANSRTDRPEERAGGPKERAGAAAPSLAGLRQTLGKVRASTAARRLGLSLRGDGGRAPAEARRQATVTAVTELAAGNAALGKRQLSPAVEALQRAYAALALMDGVDDAREQALDGLARAYTFQEDYGRAVVWMQRLLAAREARIGRARKAGEARALLLAQASWVKALMSMGWIRLRNGQYDKALAVNAKAIALYKQVKRPLLAGPAHEQRRIIAEKKGDAKEALAAARAALGVASALLKEAKAAARAGQQVAVADAARRVARLLRMRFSDYRRATRLASQAEAQVAWAEPSRLKELLSAYGATRKQLIAVKKQKNVALAATLKGKLSAILAEGKRLRAALVARVAILLEIARIHGARGDYGGAVKRAEQAQAVATRAQLSAQIPVATLEVVNNLYYMGAYRRALARAQRALARAKKVKDRLRQIQFHNVKGTILSALGKVKPALRSLNAALRIAERIANPTEIAASHNNIGDALRRAGRLPEAHESFSRALVIDRQREDKLGMSFDFANLGLTERLLGRTRQARRHLNQAVALARELGAPLNELKARIGLGRLALDGRDAKAAARQFAAGRALARKLGLRNWLWRFLLWSARVARRGGDQARAKRWLVEAVAIVEAQPPRLRPAVGARQVEARPEAVFDELIDLLAEAGEARQAFDLLERLRGRSFVDLVSKSAAALDVPVGKELGALVADQVALEAARTERMRARPGSKDQQVVDKEIARLEQTISQRRLAVAAVRPALVGLVKADVAPHARLVDKLRAHADVTFVSYYPGRRRLLAWVLRGEQLTLRRVPITRAALLVQIRELRRRLVRFHPVEGPARRLYQLLLGRVLGDGKQKRVELPARLVVLPAGPLHLLPFAALHDGTDYIVGRTTLSQLPSLNALRTLGAPSSRPASAAGLAVSFARGEAPRPGGGLIKLPFVSLEAAAFGRTFAGARLLSGQRADSAELLRSAPEARLLHIATHAAFDADAPLRSHLALADGPFELRRVFAMPLKAELVLLSGCETGLGALAGAEGILGLHSAFLTAGARRVVSSLWRVSDLGTALLMKHLFRRLAAGEAPAQALRGAQQIVRKRLAHPAFWSGFRLDGAP